MRENDNVLKTFLRCLVSYFSFKHTQPLSDLKVSSLSEGYSLWYVSIPEQMVIS